VKDSADPDRKRAVRGGYPYKLGIEGTLAKWAVWLWLYLGTEA